MNNGAAADCGPAAAARRERWLAMKAGQDDQNDNSTRVNLSERLELVVSFVEKGSRPADVGTDHGYVPIALVERGIAPEALAMDVREGPLARAREHISRHGLSEKIRTRLSDGVTALEEGEADTVIAAGMGGELIIHILRDGRRLWYSVAHWILSPQSEPEKVRVFLQENGFCIRREAMLSEDGIYYVVMDAVRGRMEPLDGAQAFYGPCLIRDRDPVLKEYLVREKGVLERILAGLGNRNSTGAAARREELSARLALVERTLEKWRMIQDGGDHDEMC